MDQVQKEQAAYIDLLNNELGARISLVARSIRNWPIWRPVTMQK